MVKERPYMSSHSYSIYFISCTRESSKYKVRNIPLMTSCCFVYCYLIEHKSIPFVLQMTLVHDLYRRILLSLIASESAPSPQSIWYKLIPK